MQSSKPIMNCPACSGPAPGRQWAVLSKWKRCGDRLDLAGPRRHISELVRKTALVSFSPTDTLTIQTYTEAGIGTSQHRLSKSMMYNHQMTATVRTLSLKRAVKRRDNRVHLCIAPMILFRNPPNPLHLKATHQASFGYMSFSLS